MSAGAMSKLLALLALGVAGYLGLNVYSQPLATYRQIEPIRTFLSRALAHDTVALAMQAGDEQPTRWALEATRLDSAAVPEWAESRPRVTSDVFHAPSADCPAHLMGTWEYRQRAGDGYDNEGERLELGCKGSSPQGLYYGLEREGEHGLFYTLVEMTDLKISPEGELSFTVPEREVFSERPKNLQDVEQKKLRSAGFTRDELHLHGSLKAGTISLTCTSKAISCPEKVMVFRKGKWSG